MEADASPPRFTPGRSTSESEFPPPPFSSSESSRSPYSCVDVGGFGFKVRLFCFRSQTSSNHSRGLSHNRDWPTFLSSSFLCFAVMGLSALLRFIDFNKSFDLSFPFFFAASTGSAPISLPSSSTSHMIGSSALPFLRAIVTAACLWCRFLRHLKHLRICTCIRVAWFCERLGHRVACAFHVLY